MWILFGPVEPTTSHSLPFLTKENKLLTFFSHSLLYSYCPLPCCPSEISFSGRAPPISSIFPDRSHFLALLSPSLLFLWTFTKFSVAYLGCAAQICAWRYGWAPTKGMRSRSHSKPLLGLYFVLHLHHPWSRKALNSSMNISSASFTTTLKLTRTFNIVNSTKLEEATLKQLSSLSLHPKMTEHFRVTPGNTQTQACTHSPRTINRDLI